VPEVQQTSTRARLKAELEVDVPSVQSR
jgi:hypothetical protein